MKRFFTRMSLCLATSLSAISCGMPTLRASDDDLSDPVLVVSIAPIKKVLGDISYVMRTAGVAEFSGMVSGAVNAYTTGVNREKPIGVTVQLDDNGQPVVIAFLPVDDVEAFLEPIKLLATNVDDLEDGLYGVTFNGQTIFAQHSGDWLFIAQQEAHLDHVPEDPLATIDKLSKRYTLGVRAMLSNLPDELKDTMIGQIREAYTRAMEQQAASQTEQEKAAAEAAGEQSMQQMERGIKETSELVLGLAADSSAKKVNLEMGVQFVEGSTSDTQIAKLAKFKTAFPAFDNPEASVAFRFGQFVSKEEAEQMKVTIDAAWQNGYKQMEKNSKNPADLTIAKAFLDAQKQILDETLAEGIIDMGMVTNLNSGFSAVIGTRVSDGPKFAKSLKDAVSKATGKDVPKVKFDASKYKDVTFHTGTIDMSPGADPKAKEIFGEKVSFVVGTAAKAVYVSIGKDCEAQLKAVVDANASGKDTKSPMALRADVGQIVAFADQIDSNPQLAAMLKQLQQNASSDTVQVQSEVLPHGVLFKTTIDEGVIKAIGASAKAGR